VSACAKRVLFIAILLLALASSAISLDRVVLSSASGSVPPTTRNFTLYGAFFGGWGFTSANITSPGPTIVVEQDDTVNMTLISNDGVTHNFFVSYTNTSTPSLGDPKSNDFSTTTNFQFVATTTIGTYKYYCFYHSPMMWGYFQVVQTGTIPEFQPMILLSLFVITTAVAALSSSRRRRI